MEPAEKRPSGVRQLNRCAGSSWLVLTTFQIAERGMIDDAGVCNDMGVQRILVIIVVQFSKHSKAGGRAQKRRLVLPICQ